VSQPFSTAIIVVVVVVVVVVAAAAAAAATAAAVVFSAIVDVILTPFIILSARTFIISGNAPSITKTKTMMIHITKKLVIYPLFNIPA